MVELPDVTLCCVDTTSRASWSLRALEKSQKSMRFGDVIFFRDERVGIDCPGIRSVPISALAGVEDYSRFVICDLPDYVCTSHVLICQWDGYVISPERWSLDFLDFDYIGAPWTHSVLPPGNVGNGGFSLRSKRLMSAVRELGRGQNVHPEDWFIGVTVRAELELRGLRFADPRTAESFSIEDGSWDESSRPFGFHAPYHFPQVMSTEELMEFLGCVDSNTLGAWWLGNFLREMNRWVPSGSAAWSQWIACLSAAIESAPMDWVGSWESTELIKALIRYGYSDQARQLLDRRAEEGAPLSGDRKLRARAWAAGVRDHLWPRTR